MPINSFLYPATQVAGGYEVANSLRLNSGSSDYLERTYGTPTNSKIFALSWWTKICFDSTQGDTATDMWGERTDTSNRVFMGINSTGVFDFFEKNGGSNVLELKTNRIFRDQSSWYHFLLLGDSTQGTASNRIKLYVNGVQETSFSTETYPSQNYDFRLAVNSTKYFGRIGLGGSLSTNYYDGYLAEAAFVDGTVTAHTDYGEFDSDTGIWKPIDVSGLTFGTNGFYLDFENSGSLGADVSGNGNNFTVNNLTSIDQTTDTPTNNFCTINSLAVNTANIPTMTDGNLTALSTTGANASLLGTLAVGSGKWYYEVKCISGTGGDRVAKVGWGNPDKSPQNQFQASIVYRNSDGNKYIDNSGSAYGSTWTDNDIIGVALDISGGTVTFYKNGTTQGNITISGGLDDGTFYIPHGDIGNTDKLSFNFGNPPFTISSGNSDGNGYGNFEYAVPSGYYALNTKNLTEYG